MERQIIKHLDKKIFGIAIDAGSGLKKALKQLKAIPDTWFKENKVYNLNFD